MSKLSYRVCWGNRIAEALKALIALRRDGEDEVLVGDPVGWRQIVVMRSNLSSLS